MKIEGIKGCSYGIDAPYLLPVPAVFIIANILHGIGSRTVWPFLAAALVTACVACGWYTSGMRKKLRPCLFCRDADLDTQARVPKPVSHAAFRAWALALAGSAGIAHPQSQLVATQAGDWPCFRGPGRMGVAPAGNEAVPLEWSDTKNIIWKVELSGCGASSPIVWGDHVYVTAYTGYGLVKNDPHQNMPKLTRHLLCVDRRNGAVRWQADQPAGDTNEHGLADFLFLHGYASSTPVADESGVYVYLGRGGVIAHDHTGRRRWHSPIGGREHTWGSASSPIIFENLLIVHADPEANALIALGVRHFEKLPLPEPRRAGRSHLLAGVQSRCCGAQRGTRRYHRLACALDDRARHRSLHTDRA